MVIFLKLENNKFSKSKIYLFPKTVFKKKKIVVFLHLGIMFLKLTQTGNTLRPVVLNSTTIA